MAVLARSDVPAEARWNAESVFANPQDWDAAYAALEADLGDAGGFPGTLQQSPERLLEWFRYSEGVLAALGKLRVYATMDHATNALDEDATRRLARFRGLAARVQEAFAFAKPELLAAPRETLEGWLEQPDLALYRHAFERLWREAPHTRSAEVEALLGAVSDPFMTATSAHGVLADRELDFGQAEDSEGRAHDITQGTVRTLLGSSDRALRQSAFARYADAHVAAQETMATLLAAGVKQNVFLARARRYGSALEAALAPDDLPLSVFHGLLETYRANLGVWHRYWRAKRRLLGLSELRPHDTQAALTERGPTVPFEQAVAWLQEAMKPLGEEYVSAMTRGALQERWVDRAVNKGKRMGAFSTGSPGTHPFIMMSYTDDLLGMSTLAHELGHSLHSYLANEAQPFVYSRYGLFAAEVASNFNQAVLRHYLFEQNLDRDFELALLEEAFANFYRYFFIMPTLARFELEIHERVARGEALTAKDLSALMVSLFKEAYGDEVVMDAADEARVGSTWAQFHTHLYSRFYAYQYATGISGAHALANGVLRGEPGAAERYVGFLKAGGSMYPLDALKAAGVALDTPAPVEETFRVLEGLVERLEALA
jgi:oligoendopeptidase F